MHTPARPVHRPRFRHLPLIAAFACAFGAQFALGATYTVRNNNDSGAESLRQAIDDANAACATAPHTIDFSGAFVIMPSTPLPAVACANVEILGASQVVIDGSSLNSAGCGLTGAPAAATRISGVEIRNFTYGGASYGFCGTVDATNNKSHNNVKGFFVSTGSTLTSNEIHSNSARGVYVDGAATLNSNTIYGNPGGGVEGLDNMVLAGNTITGNSDGEAGFGVRVGASASLTGNTIGSNGWYGIDAGSNASVKGNTVSGHTEAGIWVTSGTIGGGPIDGETGEPNFVYGNNYGIYSDSSVTIQNNYIGTSNGTSASANEYGIYLDGTSNASVIGNVISGNVYAIVADLAGGTSITGNHIGVNQAGTAALPNEFGISAYFFYGGAITDNVISGNINYAVELTYAENATLSANKVGTNKLGNAIVANATSPGAFAIEIYDGTGLTISGNQISGNGGKGLYFSGLTNTSVSGNLIGTAADGVTPLANNAAGIFLDGSFCQFVDAGYERTPRPKVAMTGCNVFSGNTIAHNSGDGFFMYGGVGAFILGGSIHSNSGKNINLDYSPGTPPYPPLPNDVGDSDPGPNDRQNWPEITSVTQSGGTTTVAYKLDSTPGTTFDLEFFSNAGEVSRQSATVTTNVSGLASGSVTLAGTYTNITALASGPSGTSEFSPPFTEALAPSATILPASIDFGNVAIGAWSAFRTITITSNGTAPYQISALISGASPPSCPGSGVSICTSGDFTCSTNCAPTATYAPGTSCTVSAAFAPLSTGPKATNIYVCDNTSATARAIGLAGNALAPASVTITPGSVDFGNVLVGARSAAARFTVSNPGPGAASLGPIATGNSVFALDATTCASSLAPLASCTADISFVPTSAGVQNGVLTVPVTNAGSTAATASLQGTGTQQGAVSLPASIDFGTLVLNGPREDRTVEVRNTGNGPLTISSVSVTAPFGLQNPCPTTLAAGATCVLTLSFTPSSFGTFNGTLAFSSDAQGGNIATALSAVVSSVPYAVSPTIADFGSVMVGSDSTPRSFQFTNSGTSTLPLGAIAASGDFRLSTNTCGNSVAPSSSCTLGVVFRPLAGGPRSGTLTIPVNLSGAPGASASLQGNGVQQPVFTLPGSVAFGSLTLGSGTATRTVQVTNSGNAALAIDSVTVTAPFALQNGCPATVQPGASCTLTITFSPDAFGTFNGTLIFSSNAGGAQSAVLSATVSGLSYALTPTSADFGPVLVGTTSPARSFALSNSGNAALELAAPVAGGDFSVASTTCGSSLPARSSCSANVVFAPSQLGARAASLSIAVKIAGAPAASAALQGTGTGEASFTLPASVDFGSVGLGAAAVVRVVEVRNTGTLSLAISSIFASGPFTQTNNCPSSLAPAAACAVTLSFLADSFGPATGSLSITSNAAGGTRTAALQANVNSVAYSISPLSLDFGGQRVGGESAARTLRIFNGAARSLPLGTPVITGDFRLVANGCATSLAANSSCTLDVAFRPASMGSRSGSFSMPVPLAGAPSMNASLAGSGEQPAISVPASVDFGPSMLGAAEVVRTVQVRNTGNATLQITSATVSAPFRMSSACGSQLAAGDACTITLTFSPTAFGTFNGTLSIVHDAATSPSVVSLTASVQSLPYALSPESFDFGPHLVGSDSPPSAFRLANAGDAALAIGSLATSGDFRILTTSCGSSLPARSSCGIDVIFRPAQLGTVSGALSATVNLGEGAPPARALLQGTGVLQGLLSLPRGIDFGVTPLGGTLSQALEVRNVGNGRLDLHGIAVSGPFRLTHDCPASLAPAQACTVTMTFTANGFGDFTGTLSIASNSLGGDRAITLLASVSGVPFTLVPREWDFGNQLVGGQSATHRFQFSNTGDAVLPIEAPATTGPFRIVETTCTGGVPAHRSCSIDVAFAPTAFGSASGSLAVPVGLPGSPPARTSLFGNGTQQAALALPERIDFGTFTLDLAAGAQRTLELRNTGNAVLTFTVSISGPFVLSGDCAQSLEPSQACSLLIRFTGLAVGEFNGALSVVSNAPGGSRSIPLVARVQPVPLPVIRIDPTSLGFGDRILGTPSATQRVTVTNEGSVDAQLGPLNANPDFVVHWQCGPTLAPQRSCTADIAFRPMRTGPRSFRLEVPSNAADSPHAIDLFGRGCSFPRPGQRPSCS